MSCMNVIYFEDVCGLPSMIIYARRNILEMSVWNIWLFYNVIVGSVTNTTIKVWLERVCGFQHHLKSSLRTELNSLVEQQIYVNDLRIFLEDVAVVLHEVVGRSWTVGLSNNEFHNPIYSFVWWIWFTSC